MLDRIVSGDSHKDIADDFDVSRALVIRYFLHRGPERKQRYLEARALSAVAHVERADELLEDADENSNAGVQKAKHRADLRKFMAERYDRATFGTQVDVNHTVDFGTQLLGVLRKFGRPANEVPEGESEALTTGVVAALPLPDVTRDTLGAWQSGPGEPRIDSAGERVTHPAPVPQSDALSDLI